MNDVWVTFQKGIPMDVFMSEEAATTNKFHSERVEHYIHVTNSGVPKTREEQLIRTNALLLQQIEDLTTLLEKTQRRVGLLERLLNMPTLMRSGRASRRESA
jgi:hypothetical protein